MSKAGFIVIVFLFSLLSLLQVSCQTKPTQVYESIDAKLREGKKVSVPANVVIVDARPAFDYSLSHINGSVNLRWDEFTQNTEAFRGLFEGDLFFHTRRLARYGITPDSTVIVVGRGRKGGGEEGRMAWTLQYLGVNKVKFVSIDAFERPRTLQEAPEPVSQPIWKPQINESLIVGKKEFLAHWAENSKTDPTATPASLVGSGDLVAAPNGSKSWFLIDVRPEAEYLGKKPGPFSKPIPDMGAINIPWTEFLTEQGSVNAAIRERLLAVGLLPEQDIYVIANRGVESASVTLALRELGFAKAANFAGGYAELVAEAPVAPKPKKLKRRH